MDKKVLDYAKKMGVFYKPNFCTSLGLSIQTAEKAIKELIDAGVVEKVFVPKFYYQEDSRHIFLTEYANADKKLSIDAIKYMRDQYGYSNIDAIDWSIGYRIK